MRKHVESLEDKCFFVDCVESIYAILYGTSHALIGLGLGIDLEEGRYKKGIASARSE
jgi:hypothetical protein